MRISRASRVATILALGLHALPALAELPLTVEDLVTDKGKFKLDASFSYANVDRNGVSAGEPIQVQTGPTSFVQVPTAVGERLDSTFKCNTPSPYEVLPWNRPEPIPT